MDVLQGQSYAGHGVKQSVGVGRSLGRETKGTNQSKTTQFVLLVSITDND